MSIQETNKYCFVPLPKKNFDIDFTNSNLIECKIDNQIINLSSFNDLSKYLQKKTILEYVDIDDINYNIKVIDDICSEKKIDILMTIKLDSNKIIKIHNSKIL